MNQKYCVYDPNNDAFLVYIIYLQDGSNQHGWVNNFTDTLQIGAVGIALSPSLFHEGNYRGVTSVLGAYRYDYAQSLFAVPVHEPSKEYLDKYPKFEWGIPLMELLEEWSTRSIA